MSFQGGGFEGLREFGRGHFRVRSGTRCRLLDNRRWEGRLGSRLDKTKPDVQTEACRGAALPMTLFAPTEL